MKMNDAQQAAPGDDGIVEGGEGGLIAGNLVHLPEIEDGPSVHDPLIPAGFVGMRIVHALMVGEHEHLVVPDDAQQIAQGGVAVRNSVGDIGGHIDNQRHDDKE